MFRILIFLLIGIVVLFSIKLARLVMKYSGSSKKSFDDLNSELNKKRYDIEEADFREIPPDEEEKN